MVMAPGLKLETPKNVGLRKWHDVRPRKLEDCVACDVVISCFERLTYGRQELAPGVNTIFSLLLRWHVMTWRRLWMRYWCSVCTLG